MIDGVGSVSSRFHFSWIAKNNHFGIANSDTRSKKRKQKAQAVLAAARAF
jgi:hypothetical protein